MEQLTPQNFMLNQQKIGYQFSIDNATLEDLPGLNNVDLFLQREIDRVVIRLRAYMLTENLPPEQLTQNAYFTTDVPASWWDHWKLEHENSRDPLTRWVIRRWPVNYVQKTQTAILTVDLSRFRAYPKALVPVPSQLGAPVLMHTLDTNIVYYDNDV